MTKDTQMTSCEAEIKAVAKAVTSSLKRDGHNVPHSSVLSALAAALNKRDWQKLKADLRAPARTPLKTPVPVPAPAPAALPAPYDDKTAFFLRLAWALGRPVVALPEDAAQAKAEALAQCGEMLNGVLKWGGWTVPAGLIFATSRLDAGDFAPEKLTTAAAFVVRLPRCGEVSIEVGFRAGDGWYLTRTGASDFFAAMAHRVSNEQLLGAATPATGARCLQAAEPLEAYVGPDTPAPPTGAWPLDPALFEPFLRTGRPVTFTAVVPLATLLAGEMHDYLREAFEHPSLDVELRDVKSRVLEGGSEPDCTDTAHEGDVTLQIIATLGLFRS